jgi:hypothetical protein
LCTALLTSLRISIPTDKPTRFVGDHGSPRGELVDRKYVGLILEDFCRTACRNLRRTGHNAVKEEMSGPLRPEVTIPAGLLSCSIVVGNNDAFPNANSVNLAAARGI